MFVQLFSTIKVNFEGKIVQSAYLCHFSSQEQKITNLGFNLISDFW